MKNLLVTGGCGFIGSNFIRYLLLKAGFKGRVINIDKLGYAGNPLNLGDIQEEFGERYVFVHGDICDRDLVASLFKTYAIDAVCHFAAESHVDRSIHDPSAFVQSNVVGTFTLLEVAREFKSQLQLFHHVSTDEVFGSLDETGFFTETTPYHPRNPYSASKAASDHFVRSYYNTYELPVTVTNCSNNYGPYQFPEKLIPLVIHRLVSREAIPVYGQGAQIRDWLHVEDHARAVWKVMQVGRVGDTYNVGGEGESSNLETVHRLCDLYDEVSGSQGSRDLIQMVKDRPGHDFRYAMDTSKIESELGWKPQYTLESGLKETLQWYLSNEAWVGQVLDGSYQDWVTKNYQR